MPLEEMLRTLRDSGWSVAVHNDYRINGESATFWLFTHADGTWKKGEGKTDREAVRAVLGEIMAEAGIV